MKASETTPRGWTLHRRLIAGWERLSVVSLDARRQIGVSVALITIIPMLAFGYELLALARTANGPSVVDLLVVLGGIVSAFLGYLMLCAYPVNVARLRQHLEDLLAGRLGGNVRLMQGMGDIPAIERAMQTVMHEFHHKVERVEDEVGRVERLLSARLVDHVIGRGPPRPWAYVHGDPATQGLVQGCLGSEGLAGLLTDVLDLVECAGAAFERDGNLALGIAASAWARALNGADGRLFQDMPESATGLSLRAAAQLCMRRADMAEERMDTGGWCFFVPLRTRGKVTGSVGFALGLRPAEPEHVAAIATRYGRAPAELLAAPAPEPLPDFVITLAKYRLISLARLIGESMERQLAEEELREHRDNLEATVQARTADLEKANAKLEDEVKERRRAEELKDEFVSTVSHELRTPLAITKEGIALMLDGIPGPVNDKQRKVLTSARGNIDRLARIINDLLDISKIEAGKMQLAKDRVDFATLAEGVVRNFENMAQQKGLQLELALNLKARDVLADQDRIIQVLTNLISNALKFTPKGGVRVLVENRENVVECAVTDTGIGLAAEDAARVFEKFTQFGRTYGAGEKGTGLGLAIARQIVDLHRGRIWVESAPGKGSRFTFTIPVFSDAELVRETIDMAIVEARTQKENFILLLFELDPRLAPHDAARRAAYDEGFRRLKAIENLVRSSDRMATRGSNQVVMVARIAPAQIATLFRRWRAQVSNCFTAVDHSLDVHLSCGYAEYPTNGDTSAELLERAGQTLSPADAAP